MALMITMVMITIVGMSAMGILLASRDEIEIAANNRRARVARFAAEAGLEHFLASGMRAEGVLAAAGGQEGAVLIPLTTVDPAAGTRKGQYEVKVSFCCEPDGAALPANRFRVVSVGTLQRGDTVFARSSLSATIETYDPGSAGVDPEAQGSLSARALATQGEQGATLAPLPPLPEMPR